MKKVRISIAVLTAVFFALFAACFALVVLSGGIVGPSDDLGEGLALVFGVLFSIIPLYAGFPVIIALFVLTVCMFAVKKKLPTAIAELIFLLVYLPALVVLVYVICATYLTRLAVLAALTAGMGAVYLAVFVLACVYVHLCRSERRLPA